MSYTNNDKVTWKCYPTNVETFEGVSYPVVDTVLKERKSLYSEINHIDKLPNPDDLPDSVGHAIGLNSPVNREPVRASPNTSLEPIVIITDAQPGMIMPGNISFSLPNNSHKSNEFIYPDSNLSSDKENNLNGDVILKSPYVTIMETTQVNEPLRMQIDSNILQVQELVEKQDKHDSLRIMSQQEFHLATSQKEKEKEKDFHMATAQKEVEPVKITSIAQVQQSRELNQKPNPVAVESYPRAESLPVMNVKLKQRSRQHKNKLMHKILMYVSIALVIYLLYVLFYEK